MAFIFGGFDCNKGTGLNLTLDSIEMIPLYPVKSAKGKIIKQKWKALTIQNLPPRALHVMSAVSDNTLMIVGGQHDGNSYQEAQFVDIQNREVLQTFSTEQVNLQHISRSFHVMPFGAILTIGQTQGCKQVIEFTREGHINLLKNLQRPNNSTQ